MSQALYNRMNGITHAREDCTIDNTVLGRFGVACSSGNNIKSLDSLFVCYPNVAFLTTANSSVEFCPTTSHVVVDARPMVGFPDR
jgi:hypothetical protein